MTLVLEDPVTGEVVDVVDLDTKKREPGCQCHLEEGDSLCPVHRSEEDVT